MLCSWSYEILKKKKDEDGRVLEEVESVIARSIGKDLERPTLGALLLRHSKDLVEAQVTKPEKEVVVNIVPFCQ